MKVYDRVIVPPEATGLGYDIEAVVEKVETFMGQTLVTVNYDRPTPDGRGGGCYVESILRMKEEDECNPSL